jgi:hypothetical protein
MKQKTVEQLEAKMAKLKEKENALHEERRALAAERRKLLDSQDGDAPDLGSEEES